MSRICYVLLFVVSLFSAPMQASSKSPVQIESVALDIHDKASLQRGARLFMNYCSGCHSLKYMRYQRMAKDLGLTDFNNEVDRDLLYNNLIFTQSEMYQPVNIAMPAQDALQWFGIVPPDLSLTARQRGTGWIYTYLKSFYEDKSRTFGTNNLLVPAVAMPNVLGPLQGERMIVKKKNAEGEEQSHLLLIKKGRMSEHEFDSSVRDLVNFLAYVGEPAKLHRYRLGLWVMLFLFVFLIAAYRLKKNYWKDIR